MELSFNLINSLVIHPYNGVDDHRLKKNLLTISQNFTSDRKQIEDYLESDEMVSAYTCFYFPTNFVKLGWLFDRLPKELTDSFHEMDFIDVGSGPGTYSAAFLHYIGESFKGSVLALETSKAMIRQSHKTMTTLFPQANFVVNSELKSERKRILFFGNSLNEMGRDKAKSYIRKYKPEVIILIEPGTSEFFAELLPLRTEFLQSGYHVAYPCPQSGKCPMEGKEDWCHQVMKTTHEPSIEQLSQILHKDRRSMPMVNHVYTKSIVSPSSKRVVRIFPETKFSYEFQLCQDNALIKFETMKKQYAKDEKDKIKELVFGDALSIEVEKILGDGKIRGKII